MRSAALSLALLLTLASPPLHAQEAENNPDIEEGMSLLERGIRLFFRGLMGEMEPAMRDMAEAMDGFVANAEPMLRELARIMDDLQNYHPPEKLPNGDIIIRRKSPAEVAPQGEIEL